MAFYRGFLVGWLLVSACSAAAVAAPDAPPQKIVDLYADTWVATDAFKRQLPGRDECGAPRPGKIVALFYWTWHIPSVNPGCGGVYDNTRILSEALAKGAAPQWPKRRANHFWGEPELGYYTTTDPFVLRRHASMLADAGVDVICFDVTNPPFTWKKSYMALGRAFTEMRKDGNRTPAIAFLCPFGNPTVVAKRLFKDLYQPGLYRDLWFMWKGKPLILADPKYFRNDPEIANFFTFRKPIPGYWTKPSGPNQWPWLQVYPQYGFPNEKGEIEVVAVGVAQNAIPGARPRADEPSHRRDGTKLAQWRERPQFRSDFLRPEFPGAMDAGLRAESPGGVRNGLERMDRHSPAEIRPV